MCGLYHITLLYNDWLLLSMHNCEFLDELRIAI